MGAWNASINGNDTAQDLKQEYTCAFFYYSDVEEAVRKIVEYAASQQIDESDPEWVLRTVISGRDMVTGLPKSIEISSRDVCKALEECVDEIIQGVKLTLENAPPELAADIINAGMYLAGGGAFLRGLDNLIERETGIRTIIAEHAAEAVVLGTGKSLENMNTILDHVRSRNPYQNAIDLYNENSNLK